jgi:glycosyltransferase involved in cell wall biosynthesis
LARALSLLEVFEVEPVLFVSNCRAVEESYRAYLSVPRLILPNAVDLDEFRSRNRVEACERLRLDSHRPRIAMAIRPSGDKGINLLCKIAKEPCLAQSNVEFVIAGEYPERGIFMAEIARRGLADVIKFLGHLDDVAELYAASDVVLLTSPSNSIEGSPNAILEAMACSKPVVATAVGGVPELVRDSVEGFLVSETDPSSGAFAIERLLSDAKLRENMGSAGRVRAENEHAPDSICRNLVTTIYRCIGSSHTVGGLSSAR